MIRYRCPKCKGEMKISVKPMRPAIFCYDCLNPDCRYHYEEKDKEVWLDVPLKEGEAK